VKKSSQRLGYSDVTSKFVTKIGSCNRKRWSLASVWSWSTEHILSLAIGLKWVCHVHCYHLYWTQVIRAIQCQLQVNSIAFLLIWHACQFTLCISLTHITPLMYLQNGAITRLTWAIVTRSSTIMATTVQSLATRFIASKHGHVWAFHSLFGFSTGTRPGDEQWACWAGSRMTLQRAVMRTVISTLSTTCLTTAVWRRELTKLGIFWFTWRQMNNTKW